LEDSLDSDLPELVDAFRIWSGWGQSSWPTRDDSRLRSRLGTDHAERLLLTIKKLEADFYLSNAYLRGTDLAEVEQLAKAEFLGFHPEVPEDIARILAWCYTFDWK